MGTMTKSTFLLCILFVAAVSCQQKESLDDIESKTSVEEKKEAEPAVEKKQDKRHIYAYGYPGVYSLNTAPTYHYPTAVLSPTVVHVPAKYPVPVAPAHVPAHIPAHVPAHAPAPAHVPFAPAPHVPVAPAPHVPVAPAPHVPVAPAHIPVAPHSPHGVPGYRTHIHTTITKEVPVHIPAPYPVTVEKHIPVPVPAPYPVHVPKPYPVPVPQPYPVPVEKHIPVPVDRPVPVPVPVDRPVPVPVHVAKPVAVPVPVHHKPVPVAVHYARPHYAHYSHPAPAPAPEHPW